MEWRSEDQVGGDGAVERFVRSLIADNHLSLARNIVEALGEEYNYLKLEIEVKAGNYRRANEIFNMLPDSQRRRYVHLVDSIEKDFGELSEAFERILKELNGENYPLALSELQRLKTDHPQIVEVVALELLTAKRRNEKRRVATLAEVLKKLDATHPALTQVERRIDLGSFLVPAMLLTILAIVLVNLGLAVINVLRPPVADLTGVERDLKTLSSSLETVKQLMSLIETKLVGVETNLAKSGESWASLSSDLESKLRAIEEYFVLLRKEIKTLEGSRTVRIVQTSAGAPSPSNVVSTSSLQKLEKQINAVLNALSSLSSRSLSILERLAAQAQNNSAVEGTDQFQHVSNLIQRQFEIILELNSKLGQLLESTRSLSAGRNQPAPSIGQLPAPGESEGLAAKPTFAEDTAEQLRSHGAKLEELIKKVQELGEEVARVALYVLEVDKNKDRSPTYQSIGVEDLRVQNRDLGSAELETLRMSLENLQSTLEVVLRELNQIKINLPTEEFLGLPALVAGLEPRDYTTQLGELLASVKKVESSLEELSSGFGNIRNELTSENRMTDDWSKLRTEISSKVNTIENLVRNVAEKLASVISSVSENRVERAETAELAKMIAELRGTMVHEMDSLRAAVQLVQGQIEAVNRDVKLLETNASARAELSKAVAVVRSEIGVDMRELLNELNGELNGKFESLRNSVASMLEKVSKMEIELGGTKAEQVPGRELLNVLAELRLSFSKEIESLRNSLKVVQDRLDGVAGEMRGLRQNQTVNINTSELISAVRAEVGNELTTLKESIRLLSEQVQTLKDNFDARVTQIYERFSASKAPLPLSPADDVKKVISETRDLRELYVVGLRFYSNNLLDHAEQIFAFLEDRLQGLDVYFSEDVYYFLINTYFRLGKLAEAKQALERYEMRFPDGDYVRELRGYVK